MGKREREKGKGLGIDFSSGQLAYLMPFSGTFAASADQNRWKKKDLVQSGNGFGHANMSATTFSQLRTIMHGIHSLGFMRMRKKTRSIVYPRNKISLP